MGLIDPSTGHIEINGEQLKDYGCRRWQKRIAHVPQIIYLADNSIAENIAFGVPFSQIDHVRVRDAAKKAQLAEFIEALPAQYQTSVGERGVRLSGGQRQRIGLARALYKQADVLVLDEATSALDDVTEKSVMEAIGLLGSEITVLMIAHRVTTLRNCNIVVKLMPSSKLQLTSVEEISKTYESNSTTPGYGVLTP
jgi:ATP-binding cassette subfamily B protein